MAKKLFLKKFLRLPIITLSFGTLYTRKTVSVISCCKVTEKILKFLLSCDHGDRLGSSDLIFRPCFVVMSCYRGTAVEFQTNSSSCARLHCFTLLNALSGKFWLSLTASPTYKANKHINCLHCFLSQKLLSFYITLFHHHMRDIWK